MATDSPPDFSDSPDASDHPPSLVASVTEALLRLDKSWRTLNRNAQLYVISNTLQAVTAGAIGVLYTLYLVALGYHTDFIGAALVVATIGGGLGIIPANPLVRRLGWRAMLIWSDLIGGVAIATQIIFPTSPIILITMLGIGASVAIVLVINTPLLTAYSTPRERTALFGLNNATNFLAAIIGALLGGVLPGWFAERSIAHSDPLLSLRPLLVVGAQARSYELALLVTGAIALPSIIPIFFLHDALRDQPGNPGNTNDAGQVIPLAQITLSTTNTGSGDAQLSTPSWQARLRQMWCVLRRTATGVIGQFSLTQALVGLGAGIFFPYVNLYFVNTLHTTVAFYGVLSAALSVLVALASLLAAPLAARFGNTRLAIAVQVASLPFLVLVGLAPALWLVTLAYLTRGALMAINNPPLQTFFMERVEQKQRVLASSVYNVSFQIAWAAGAGISGWLITLAGSHFPFFVAAPFYALSALLLLRWFRH